MHEVGGITVYGPTVLNAIAILVGTHGFGSELLPMLMLDGALTVMMSGRAEEGLPPGRVGSLGSLLLNFKEEVTVFVTLCNVLSMLTLATVLTTIRESRMHPMVVRSCLLVLFVEKFAAYFGTLVVGLSMRIWFLVRMNVLNVLLRRECFMVTVAIRVFLPVSLVLVHRLLLLPLFVFIRRVICVLLMVRLLLLSSATAIRVVVEVVTCTSGMLLLSSGCLTLCMALELQVSHSSARKWLVLLVTLTMPFLLLLTSNNFHRSCNTGS